MLVTLYKIRCKKLYKIAGHQSVKITTAFPLHFKYGLYMNERKLPSSGMLYLVVWQKFIADSEELNTSTL
jgi:hypothetical protein